MKKMKVLFGEIDKVDIDKFNQEFWNSCSDEEKISAGWDLVVQAWKTKERDLDELRLQRSVIFFKPA